MTTDINRIQNIAKHAEGFIYTVTMNATTGEDGTFHPKLKDQIKMIKSFYISPSCSRIWNKNYRPYKRFGKRCRWCCYWK